MKVKFLFVSVLLFLFLLSFVSSEIVENLENIETNIGELEDAADRLFDEDERGEYLKREWTKILENTKVGSYLIKGDNFLKKSDGFFLFILGMPYGLSWLFVLTFMFWFLLLVYVYRISSFFEPFILNGSKVIRWILLFVFFGLMVYVRIPKYLSFLVVNFLSKSGSTMVQLFGVVGIFLLIIFASVISKNIEKLFWVLREEREKKISQRESKEAKEDAEEVKEKVEEEDEDAGEGKGGMSKGEITKMKAQIKREIKKELNEKGIKDKETFDKLVEEYSAALDSNEYENVDTDFKLKDEDLDFSGKKFKSFWDYFKFWKI